MLKLVGITKQYTLGGNTIDALRGVDLEFRENEFVSILGPSGCGKTTTLNIIGGLDRYTSGDLIINGRSTKDYKDGDWDAYRNHSIGFVFQSYNLISHQSVLANVELALTLAGVLVTMWRNVGIVTQAEGVLRRGSFPVFSTVIRRTDRVDESTFQRQPLRVYSPRSAANVDYRMLVEEYLRGRCGDGEAV